MEKPTVNNPERREGFADDARKFTVTDIDPELLIGESVIEFSLTVDWLETNENDEAKVVLKEFPDGRIERILVAKVTVDGKRTTKKTEITPERYEEEKAKARTLPVPYGIVKKRYEFEIRQDEMRFDIKYDEFDDSDLRILEVDAANGEGRDIFDPSVFPASNLKEVTSDRTYEGYRVADKV